MLVGFIHGVMNTDNMAISGETIDYGPCAFMDAFDPATVFSSIDHAGRYAYGNQPAVAQWNLARFAETLLPLIDADSSAAIAAATDVLQSFPERYDGYWRRGMRAKLGLARGPRGRRADRRPARAARGADGRLHRVLPRTLRLAARGRDPRAGALRRARRLRRLGRPLARAARRPAIRRRSRTAMDRVNPIYIPRNHLVEEALTAATAGDLEPFERLVDVLAQPFDERPGLEAFAAPAPPSFGSYRTFCGT